MTYFRDIHSDDIILSDEFSTAPVAGGFVLETQPESNEQFLAALRLSETYFTKKDLTSKLKLYLTNLKDIVCRRNPELGAAFLAHTASFSKEVLAGFDDYRFFIGSGGFNDAQMVILGKANEAGLMRFYYFKDGLRAEEAVPGVNPWAEYDAAVAEREASCAEESEE